MTRRNHWGTSPGPSRETQSLFRQVLAVFVNLANRYGASNHIITRVVGRLKRKGLAEAKQGGRIKVLKQRKIRTISADSYIEATRPA